MKKILSILAAVLLFMPAAFGAGNGGTVGGSVGVEDFSMKIWQCDERLWSDEAVHPWRLSGDGEELIERNNNYAFEGETYQVDVLVMDKNNIEDAEVDIIFVGSADNISLDCDTTSRGSNGDGCYGTPEEDTCENYNLDQCVEIQGCDPLCDLYVDHDTVRNCEGNAPCHITIQDAVNAASDDDRICVYDGIYNENVDVTSGVTLRSISGAGSTTVYGTGTAVIAIIADGVVIDGFTVTNARTSGIGIYAMDQSDITIRNNIVKELGNGNDDVTGRGIVIVSSSLGVDSVNILNNEIYDITSGLRTTSSSTSAAGIIVGWTSGSEDVTNLVIQCNNIYDIDADTSPWTTPTKGQGAYGILINHGHSGGQTIGAQILNNHITDLEGLWAHAIGLEGDTPSAVVRSNEIDDLVDHKTPSDAVAVQFEDNPSAETVEVSQNNFLNDDVGIQNTVLGLTVTAEDDYWGCADGPGNPGCSGTSGAGDVDFDPWAETAFAIPVCTAEPTPICEGTPDSCEIIADENKCDTETEGCSWFALADCNAMIDEEQITQFDELTMAMYSCAIEVPDSATAYGEYMLTVEAEDSDMTQTPQIDETSVWFLNPLVTVDLSGGTLDFSGVMPGTSSYDSMQVKNLAEGGVILDMFILGDDWYSAGAEQARCMQPDGSLLNKLPLQAFSYYVENGAYDSRGDRQIDDNAYDNAIVRNVDDEGYLNIHRNLNGGFDEDMFAETEILQENPITDPRVPGGEFWAANWLYPGSTGMTLTFRLDLPEPCYGTFTSTDGFYIWGEAI